MEDSGAQREQARWRTPLNAFRSSRISGALGGASGLEELKNFREERVVCSGGRGGAGKPLEGEREGRTQ